MIGEFLRSDTTVIHFKNAKTLERKIRKLKNYKSKRDGTTIHLPLTALTDWLATVRSAF